MVEHYWEHGYTLVPGVFDKKRIQDYLDRFDGLVEGTIPRADNMLVMRDIMIARAPSRRATARKKSPRSRISRATRCSGHT